MEKAKGSKLLLFNYLMPKNIQAADDLISLGVCNNFRKPIPFIRTPFPSSIRGYCGFPRAYRFRPVTIWLSSGGRSENSRAHKIQ